MINFFRKLKTLFIKRKYYDLIISIGQGCSTPHILKFNNRRRFSGPFDWTFCPNYKVPLDFLLNRFDGYFNKEDLVFLKYSTDHDCDFYKNKKTGMFHRHVFPPSFRVPFETGYKNGLERYNRRINRLLNFIESKKCKNICLVYIERAFDAIYQEDPEFPVEDVSEEILQDYIDKLNKSFDKKCFDIFFIKHDENMDIHDFKISANNRICYLNNVQTLTDYDTEWKGNFNLVEDIICARLNIKPSVLLKEKILVILNKFREKISLLKEFVLNRCVRPLNFNIKRIIRAIKLLFIIIVK